MSNKQQLINEAIKLADKGMLTKSAIKEVIKQDFRNRLSSGKSITSIHMELANKYDVSLSTIQRACNN